MTDAKEISEYLATSASEGSVQEAGSFSLSPQEAWKRLQTCLPRQEYWILKLVQAAVLWEAPVLEICSESKGCTLTLEPGADTQISSEHLLDMESGGRALQHFRLALAGASIDPQFLSVSAQWRGPGRSFDLCWAKEKELEVAAVNENVSTPRLTLTIQHGGANWFKSTFGTTPMAEEEAVLKERARPEGMQITWDGEPMTLEETAPSALKRAHLSKSKTPESIDIFFHRTLTIPKYYDWARSQKARRQRGAYGSHPIPFTRDEVAWVQDGVIIDRWEGESASTAVYCVTVINASNLKIDLSGFQISLESRALERIEKTTSTRLELLHGSLENLNDVLGHQEARRQMKRSVFGKHLLLGLLIWPYLAPSLVELFRLPKNLNKALTDDLNNASQAIRDRIDCLEDTSDRAWRRIERNR